MVNQMRGGDYVPDGHGGFARLDGLEALLQQALFRLSCRRGAMPLMPDLGSRLYTLGREKPTARRALAMAYCAEALRALPLAVTDTALREHDGVLYLTVQLRAEGQTGQVEVQI